MRCLIGKLPASTASGVTEHALPRRVLIDAVLLLAKMTGMIAGFVLLFYLIP